MKYRIFTEGDWDSNFIRDFLKHIFSNQYGNLDISFFSAGSYTNLENSKPLFEEITDAGGKNIVIFDTDFIQTDGGIANRTEYLNTQKARLGIQFELFLFPNSSDEGTFENLLESIVVHAHSAVLDCFNNYETCIGRLTRVPNGIYNTPNKKAKIYAYVETLSTKKDFEKARKANDMFYSDAGYWDLDSDNITSLRNFLTTHIEIAHA